MSQNVDNIPRSTPIKRAMILMQSGTRPVAPSIQGQLNQIHLDPSSGCLCIPTEQGIEKLSEQQDCYRRLYQANLQLSLGEESHEAESVGLNPEASAIEWVRNVSLQGLELKIDANFCHVSGRYLRLLMPLRLDGRPAYQIAFLGFKTSDVTAYVKNNVHSDEGMLPALDVHMGFDFSRTAIDALAIHALELPPFTGLPHIAVKAASYFYLSAGYYGLGVKQRLRMRLRYAGQDRTQSVFLNPSRNGLVMGQPLMTKGLQKFLVCSVGDEAAYFSIQGDMVAKTLGIYCQVPDASRHQGLVQRPMPALLWDCVTEHTGIHLETNLLESTQSFRSK